MKHKHSNAILGREPHHRHALLKGLAGDLLKHGYVVTSAGRARALRRYVEPLITEAKKELTLHRRRRLLGKLQQQYLGSLTMVAAGHKARPGGYVRLIKMPQRRHDSAMMIRVELLPGAPSGT